jgi:hypothetical protein
MADLALQTDMELRIVHAEKADIKDFLQAETLAVGDVVYQTGAGKAGKADANAGGKQQARGIVVKKIGSVVSVLKKGYLSGFDLSGMSYDDPVYLSDTAGAMGTTVGTMTVNLGRVVALTDPDLEKVLYFEADWLRTWA